MAIIRVSKQPNQFSIIDRTAAEDNALSWKAKGIMFYLLTKPDDWTVQVSDLVKNSTDGRDSVYNGLNELKAAGYITVIKKRGKNGKYTDYEYIVHENPVRPLTENPDTAKPYMENPDTEKPEDSNNDFNDNKIKKDDDDRLASIEQIFNRFKERITKESFDEVVQRVMDIQPSNFEKYLEKALETEIVKQVKKANKPASIKADQRKPLKAGSRRPKPAIIQNTESTPVTEEELQAILAKARKLDQMKVTHVMEEQSI